MKKFIPNLAISLLLALTPLHGAVLRQGHVDIGIAYENDEFEPHIHDEGNDNEFAPDEATLVVRSNAEVAIPNDPNFAFLGNADDPAWILPSPENPELLFLGIGAEEIAPGVFDNDELAGELTSISFVNPQGVLDTAHVAIYLVDAFGAPIVRINSRDGLDASDRVQIFAGGHQDYNWAFSTPGTYRLTFTFSGTIGGNPTQASATYTFVVANNSTPVVVASLGESVNISGGTFAISQVGPAAINSNGISAYTVALKVGGLVNASNNTAIVIEDGTTKSFAARRGSAAPGLSGASFRAFSDPQLTVGGWIAFGATIGGTGVTTVTDGTLWASPIDAPLAPEHLVFREGDAAPGVSGQSYVKLNWFNVLDHGIVIFSAQVRDLANARRNGVWRATEDGIELLALEGQPLLTEIGTKTVKLIARPTFYLNQTPQYAARQVTEAGAVTLRVTFSDNSASILNFAGPSIR